MKNISVFMLSISICAIGADKQVKRDIDAALSTHRLPRDAQSMQFLKFQTGNRLPVFTKITEPCDQPSKVTAKSQTLTPAFSVSQAQVISQLTSGKRKEEILSFITLRKIHARKSFRDGYTLYNNKGIITETGKQGSRSFSGNDVLDVVVGDLTINIVLKSDISKK